MDAFERVIGESLLQEQIVRYAKAVNLARQNEGKEQLSLDKLDARAIAKSAAEYHDRPRQPWLARMFRHGNPLDSKVNDCMAHYERMVETGKWELQYFEQHVQNMIERSDLGGLDRQYITYIKRGEALKHLADSWQLVKERNGFLHGQITLLAGCFKRQYQIDKLLCKMTQIAYTQLSQKAVLLVTP